MAPGVATRLQYQAYHRLAYTPRAPRVLSYHNLTCAPCVLLYHHPTRDPNTCTYVKMDKTEEPMFEDKQLKDNPCELPTFETSYETIVKRCNTREWHRSRSLMFQYRVPTHLTTHLSHQDDCTTQLPKKTASHGARSTRTRLHPIFRLYHPGGDTETARAPSTSGTQKSKRRGKSGQRTGGHRAEGRGSTDHPETTTVNKTVLGTKTTQEDYDLFLAKWERYRDGCLKRHNHDALGIALKL